MTELERYLRLYKDVKDMNVTFLVSVVNYD